MGARQCEICKEAQSKYKCPSCLVPYCSLACFKKHKEIPCAQTPSETKGPSEPIVAPRLPEKRVYEVEEQSWVLSKEQLESIALSTEIRDALKDEQLQKLICKIDASSDAENELDKTLQGETFQLFADKILSIVKSQSR
ncbi:hypothetical protein H6P81_004777 [Aristolochia fimbriata]|uniref:HIT-type domain-containing protein n=1 Tax=Aristolochia fimbriata TaxID=158543 RepID=A0AAV7ET40_ARIFI|nr:hypothetical protein H6P81_004777 [Aristolochia fimbriata]